MADTNQEVSSELVRQYRESKVTIPTIYNGVLRLGYPQCFMRGVQSFVPGQRLVGRARTVRYLPFRPDILAQSDKNEDAPEYLAMGSCGPDDALVAGACGRKWAAIGGEMVLLHLKIVGAAGLITDGGIRDMEAVLGYGYKVFAGGRTPAGRSPFIISYEQGGVVECGGIAVVPGDLIVADDEGILCVPKQHAEEVLEWSEEHEEVEEQVKEMILSENATPGKYYNAETFARLQGEGKYEVV